LQSDIRQLRMLPVANLFSGFYRMVRDLGKEQGKKVELYIEGEQTELDKKIIEEVKDPLTHILRNAIDHGLETPAVREKAGKNPSGSIWLRASQQGNSIIIEVEDDGQGINTEKLKEKAVADGLLDAGEAEMLSEEEALYLVFRSGLSTAAKVSKVSGRGVGVYFVKGNVEKVNWVVKVSSRLGQGCKFTLILPLTLTTSRVLLAGSGSYKYAIPVQSIERIVRVAESEVFRLQGQKVIKINDRNVPLFSLSEVLEQKASSQKEKRLTALVVASADKRAALTVDGLYGETEVVVKPLGAHLKRVKNVAGATVLGDGQVVIVLNASDLVKTASFKKQQLPAAGKQEAKKTILIVDDSLTTRILEKNILEAAGYQTILAANGREAWEILASRTCDLVFTDIDMPVMDGFALTSKIKQHPQLKNLPVVIVTALEDEQTRRKGLEVGADAYFVKQNFNREVILETVSQLV
jgi:two-component system chemotaxis sensor kinase CheA